jgi:alkylation response protein AidB-like acyl-CoA dehydrogenase
MEEMFEQSVNEVASVVGLEDEEVALLKDTDKAADELVASEFEKYIARKYNPEIKEVLEKYKIIGAPISKEYGGRGARQLVESLVMERLGQVGLGVITFVDVHQCLGSLAVQEWGSNDQRKRYLPKAAKGEIIFAYGLTEPEVGSDPASLTTTYRKENDGYRIRGSKYLISNGSIATHMIVFARSSDSGQISSFIVDTKERGFSVEMRLEEKVGLFTSDTSMVSFEDLFVPKEDMLYMEGKGMSVAYSALLNGRIGVGSGCLGVMEDCLKNAKERARQRIQHGKEIGKHQLIQRHIASIASSLEACRWLVYRAAIKKDEYDKKRSDIKLRLEADRLSAIAKYMASTLAFESADRAMQIFGGFGYSILSPVAKHFLDARVARIYEGTDEIMQLKIASLELGKDFEAYK